MTVMYMCNGQKCLYVCQLVFVRDPDALFQVLLLVGTGNTLHTMSAPLPVLAQPTSECALYGMHVCARAISGAQLRRWVGEILYVLS